MITITIHKGNRLKMEAEGHAGGVQGEDVVCGAVSILVTTLATCARLAYDGGYLEQEPVIRLGEDGDGYAKVVCNPKKQWKGMVAHEFYVVETGLRLLEADSPEKVHIVIK